MREIGILFQAAMVRARLAETKTQTRRAVKAAAPAGATSAGVFFAPGKHYDGEWNWLSGDPRDCDSWEWVGEPFRCPFGAPGDRLWVRETFYAFGRWETRFSEKKGRDEWHFVDMTLETGHAYCYAADGAVPALMGGRRSAGVTPAWWKRPAIHMPRVASRVLLEVTSVRVERLHDISEEDAMAEGITYRNVIIDAYYAAGTHREVTADRFFIEGGDEDGYECAVDAYAALWDSINGAGSWDANPWVWVVEFRRATS